MIDKNADEGNGQPTAQTANPNQAAKFLKHTAVYGFGSVLLQAVGIVLLPIYTHYLAPADYGVLDIINRTGDIIVVLLMANGIRGAAFTFYCQAETEEMRARTASTVAAVLFAGCFAGILATITFAPIISAALDIESQSLAVVGLAAAITQLLPALPMTLMQARVESTAYIVASLIATAFRLLLVIVGVVVLNWGVWGVLLGTLAANLVSGVFLNLREFSRTGFRPEFSVFLPVMRFAWPFVPGGIIGFALFNGDRYFLLENAGREAVGLYAVGARLASVVSSLCFAPLFQVWSASMYEAYREPDCAKVIGRVFTRLLAPSMFTGLVVYLFRTEILELLASPEYANAAPVIGPMIISSCLISAQVLGDGPFYVFRRSRTKLLVTIGTTLVAFGLYAMLIPRFHVWGATLSVVISSAFYASATILTAQSVYRIEYEWRRLFALVSIILILAAFSWFVAPDGLGLVWKIMLAIAFPLIAWSFNLISIDEKKAVTQAANFTRTFLGKRLLRSAR